MAGMAGVPTAWPQGVPQPQLPTGQMAQLQQPASMVGAYPVQQFQVIFNAFTFLLSHHGSFH